MLSDGSRFSRLKGHILMTPDVDDLNMLDGATLISKTRKVGALARPDQSKKKRQ